MRPMAGSSREVSGWRMRSLPRSWRATRSGGSRKKFLSRRVGCKRVGDMKKRSGDQDRAFGRL